MATIYLLAVDPRDHSVLAGTSSGVYYTDTRGTFQFVGMAVSPVFAIVVDSSTNPSTAYAAQYNGVATSTDGFIDWNYINFKSGQPFTSLALDTSTSPPTLYGGNNVGQIFSTSNGGATFTVENVTGFRPGNLSALAASNGIVFAALNEEFNAAISELNPGLTGLLSSSYLVGSVSGTYGVYGQAIVAAP